MISNHLKEEGESRVEKEYKVNQQTGTLSSSEKGLEIIHVYLITYMCVRICTNKCTHIHEITAFYSCRVQQDCHLKSNVAGSISRQELKL